MFSFQAASEKLSEPFSCFRLVTSTHHVTLNPRYISDVKSGIREELNGMLKLYSERFKGVLVAYNNLKLLQGVGNIMDDCPSIHFDIQGEFIIFQPSVGSVLQGEVNKLGNDFVGCLVHDCFNASVPKPRHVEEDNWPGSTLEIGDKFTFEVTKLYNQSGVISFQGKINRQSRDGVSNKRKRVSSVTVDDSPTYKPPVKKNRTRKSSMSTPMPGHGAQPFSPGVSFVQPSASAASVPESVASDVTVDSGLGGGLSPVLDFGNDSAKSDKKHKKKKKKKSKDGEKSRDKSLGDKSGSQEDTIDADTSVLGTENADSSKSKKKKKKHKKKDGE